MAHNHREISFLFSLFIHSEKSYKLSETILLLFLITRLRESILPELQSCLPEYQLMSHAF